MYVVLCSCPADQAPEIAARVVKERLAACCNLIAGVTSYYIWEGTFHEDKEATLLMKVGRDKVAALTNRLRSLHPADTPEILALPVDTNRSDPQYVAWVQKIASTGPVKPGAVA
jgi:periplasmic divalent cation tolerance protein